MKKYHGHRNQQAKNKQAWQEAKLYSPAVSSNSDAVENWQTLDLWNLLSEAMRANMIYLSKNRFGWRRSYRYNDGMG